MRTTLVTGGAGFIGSNFVERFFDHHPDERLVVLDVLTYAANPENIPERIRNDVRFKLVVGDIRDRPLVESLVSSSDRVVHFAAESHMTRSIADDLPFFETDVIGTQSIASAVAKYASRIERFVHISTSEVYGSCVSFPMDEEHPLLPCTPYAAAKAGADRLVYAYRETYNIPTVIIRPFNNYGPKQHLEKVVPRFVTSALLGEPLTIHGDGLMTRDWVYVTDTCEAVLAALQSNEALGHVINVGTGVDTSILEIAQRILDCVGESARLIAHGPPRPGQVDRHISSVQKSYKLLGWGSKVNLDTGIETTVDWYRKNEDWWRPQRETMATDVSVARRGVVGHF